MDFKDILNSYIDLIGCTARELSEASGVSTATISRYRSGERIPAPDSGHFDKLVSGIIQLAASQPELTFTEETVRELFRDLFLMFLLIWINYVIISTLCL